MKRRIAVVTGTRADYGLLTPLLHEIHQDAALELQLLVTGTHLAPEFGLTVREIEADQFPISARIDLVLSSDAPIATAKSVGLGLLGFADALAKLQPDILVLLGDRYEMFAAAQAAFFLSIPMAHLYGGERSEGALDESMRHAVTKLAQLHFVSAEPYRERVCQLGENPAHVFNFGAPGVDQLRRTDLLTRDELARNLDILFGTQNFLVTYHPTTLGELSVEAAMQELFQALDHYPQAQIIFTKSNADAGGRRIGQLIDDYVRRWPQRAQAFVSLGSQRYLSLLRCVDLVLGNSSSGLLEAPFFHKPTINLGTRQQGRLRAASVLDAAERAADIIVAIDTALSPAFQDVVAHCAYPFGDGQASSKIKQVLKTIPLAGLVRKTFFDWNPA